MIFTFEHNDLTTIVKMFNKRRNEFDEIDVHAVRPSVILMNNLKSDTNEESPVSVHTRSQRSMNERTRRIPKQEPNCQSIAVDSSNTNSQMEISSIYNFWRVHCPLFIVHFD